MEAKELIRPSNSENVDTFVRIYLVPDETGALQTKVCDHRVHCLRRNNTNEQPSPLFPFPVIQKFAVS